MTSHLWQKFTDEIVTLMGILESLIPRVNDNFEIPLITIRQTIDL